MSQSPTSRTSDAAETHTGMGLPLLNELRSSKNVEYARKELQVVIANNLCIDSTIKSLLLHFTNNADLKNITLASITQRFRMEISIADYDLIFRFLIIAQDISNEICKPVIASLAVCDPLPFTKFFLDIDCNVCHSTKAKEAKDPNKVKDFNKIPNILNESAAQDIELNHADQSEYNGKSVVKKLYLLVSEIFNGRSLECIVATKSSRPWCGMHVYFNVNLDIVMKQLIYNRILQLNTFLTTHTVDITTNGVLPLCRMYDRFFDADGCPLPININLLKSISYIDAWRMFPPQYYLEPIGESVDDYVKSFESRNEDGECSSSKRIKRSASDLFTITAYDKCSNSVQVSFTLLNGVQYKDVGHSTYDEIVKILPNCEKIGFQKSSSTFATITLNEIDAFIRPRGSISNDSVICLTKIDEFYQQTIPIKSINYTPIFAEDLEQSPSASVCPYSIAPGTSSAKLIAVKSRINFRNHLPCNSASVVSERVYNYENIPVTPQDVETIAHILQDDSVDSDLMQTVFTQMFNSISVYDVIISVCALNVRPHEDIIFLCNKESPGENVNNDDDPSNEDNRRRKQKKNKQQVAATFTLPPDRHDDLYVVVYQYFQKLVISALLNNYTLSLLSYVKQVSNKDSKLLVKLFTHILWNEWEETSDTLIQTSIRKSLKILVYLFNSSYQFLDNYLLNAYDGCELFYASWQFPVNVEPKDIYQKITSRLTQYGVSVTTNYFLSYLVYQIFSCRTVGDKIQYFNGRGRMISEAPTADAVLSFIPKVSSFVMSESMCMTVGCFSYYSSVGVVHPTIGVVENAGPFLTNKIYRNFDNNISTNLLYPQADTYQFTKDIFFKVRHYIRQMKTNTIGFILLSPVINVSVPPEMYHFKSTFKPKIPCANILLTDLAVAYDMAWSPEFVTSIQDSANGLSKFSRVWNNFLRLMLTLNKTYFIRSDPMNFLISMLGASEYQIQGLGKHKHLADNKIEFSVEQNTSGENISDISSVNVDSLCNTTDTLRIDPNSSETVFYRRMRMLFTQKVNEWRKSHNPDELSSFGTYELLHTYQEEMHRKKLSQSVFGEYLNQGKFNFTNPDKLDFAGMPANFMKLCVIIFSWFIRIGDTHSYSDSPLIKMIINHRGEIYQEFESYVLRYFHIEYVNDCAESHVKIFREYCESIVLDYSNVEIEDANAIPQYTVIDNHDFTASGCFSSNSLSEKDKHNIYTAFSYLIIFSNFDNDNFIELCKVMAGVEYCGNYFKKMYMFFGKSMGGKNVFVDNLRRVFNCGEKITLSSKHYGDSNADHNPNSALLGTMMLVNLDEPPSAMKTSDMKVDVNIGRVSTRSLFCRETESYQIVAKMFITCNDCVGPITPDDGWFRRLILFKINHTFCELKKMIHRTSSQSSGQLFNESVKYLVCQVLTCCYPDYGNGSNLVTGLTQVSYILFRRLFFFKDSIPTSFALSEYSKRLLYTYMMTYSPFFEFLNTTVIVPSDEGITVRDVSNFVQDWGVMHKKPNTSALYRTFQSFLTQYSRGNLYYVKLDHQSYSTKQ